MSLIWPVVFALVAQSPPAAAPGGGPNTDVAAVKALYSAAAYEEAIALVASIDDARLTAEHEQYRALCYLALGRSAESEAALERLVRLAPMYVLPESELSPRILTMFRDVRRRTLPVVVRDRYSAGKKLYDDGKFAEAIGAFENVKAILAEPELSYPADAFADLRQLVDGFMALAGLELARLSKPPPPPAPEPVAQAPDTAAVPQPSYVLTKLVVYSSNDADVTPPVELEREMPPWAPPAAMARAAQQYRGELQVIVDESGRVEQAIVTQPTLTAYDLTLVGATRRWRFEPARRQGEPVKYLLTFRIVLAPPARR